MNLTKLLGENVLRLNVFLVGLNGGWAILESTKGHWEAATLNVVAASALAWSAGWLAFEQLRLQEMKNLQSQTETMVTQFTLRCIGGPLDGQTIPRPPPTMQSLEVEGMPGRYELSVDRSEATWSED